MSAPEQLVHELDLRRAVDRSAHHFCGSGRRLLRVRPGHSPRNGSATPIDPTTTTAVQVSDQWTVSVPAGAAPAGADMLVRDERGRRPLEDVLVRGGGVDEVAMQALGVGRAVEMGRAPGSVTSSSSDTVCEAVPRLTAPQPHEMSRPPIRSTGAVHDELFDAIAVIDGVILEA